MYATMEHMGYLSYGASAEYEFDDRVLAHLKVAISLKLRRQESFFLSWSNPTSKGSGRVSLWMSPNIPLMFRFAGSKAPELNDVWLRVLGELSNAPRGLVVVSEREAEAHAQNQLAD
jgi:hypothetical protein